MHFCEHKEYERVLNVNFVTMIQILFKYYCGLDRAVIATVSPYYTTG